MFCKPHIQCQTLVFQTRSEQTMPARFTTHQVDRHILAQQKCRVSNYLQCSRSTSRLLNAKYRGSNSVPLTHFWTVQTIYLLSTTMRGCVHNFSHSLRYSRYKKVMKTEVRSRFCRKFLGRFWHLFIIKDGTALSETKLPLFGEHQS